MHTNVPDDIYNVLILVILRLQTCLKSLASFFDSDYKLDKCGSLLLSLQKWLFIFYLWLDFNHLHVLATAFISDSSNRLLLVILMLLLIRLCKYKCLTIFKLTHLRLPILHALKTPRIPNYCRSQPLALTLTLCIIQVHYRLYPLIEYVSLPFWHLLQKHLLFAVRFFSLLRSSTSSFSIILRIILVNLLIISGQLSFYVLRNRSTKTVDTSLVRLLVNLIRTRLLLLH